MLLRREAVASVGGLDEGFFLYSEETDLFKRLATAGWRAGFEPRATARHVGYQSADRNATEPIRAVSRVRYARKHHGRLVAALEASGVALGALAHAARLDSSSRSSSRKPYRGSCGSSRRPVDRSHNMSALTYAIVTPARNERDNLRRLAESVLAQDHAPVSWVIVDDGSDDGMREVADDLARRHDWILVAGTGEDAANIAMGRRRGRDLLGVPTWS